MPVILLERLPMPSLKTYTALSVCLFATALYYAHTTLLEDEGTTKISVLDLLDYNINLTSFNDSMMGKVYLMAYVLSREPWCIVTLINMAYCCLILFGRLIQQIVFGRLRVVEQQHVKDKFWNFVFYKFIFIFGVMNAQEMEEIVLWCSWFSVLGFLHILAQMCKDRFEYLSFSPATPLWTHSKVLLLLFGVHVTCLSLLAFCVAIGYYYTGINTFAFMAAETLLLVIKTLYILVRYAIHLWDVHHDGVWENRAICVYYCELVFEISVLLIDFCHHLHMLLWGNIFLSMASLVICMQLRYLFHEFQRRVRRHQNYRRVVSRMEARFPMASTDELQRNSDDCAICWERMESGRQLPCGHIFHNACLRSWLEQDTSCPTCRLSLSDLNNRQTETATTQNGGVAIDDQTTAARRRARRTNRFHFDASRYVSWLPSFSVEVTHMLGGYTAARQQPSPTSQFDNMARQVHEVFPSIPLSVILEDLHVTNSVELTIDNIVEGRLPVAPDFTAENASTLVAHDDNDSASTSDDNDDDEPIRPSPGLENQLTSRPAMTGDHLASHISASSLLFSDRLHRPVAAAENRILFSIGESARGNVRTDGVDSGAAAAVNDTSPLSDTASQCSTAASHNDEHISCGSGYRFSKSPSEREAMLAHRKESLIESARRRFLVRDPPVQSASSSSPSTATSTSGVVRHLAETSAEMEMLRQRRELVYNAIQRRLQSP